MKFLPVCLLLLGVAHGAAAAPPDRPGTEAAPRQASDDDDDEIVVEGETDKEKRRVCETRATTGSIMPKRVCRTVAQIEAEERAARAALDRINRDREARDQIQLNREPGL